jgi:hypothetical protein
MPLFYCALDQTTYIAQSDSEENTSGSYLQFDIGLDYFNAKSGCYEPVVEEFPIMLKLSSKGKSSEMKL